MNRSMFHFKTAKVKYRQPLFKGRDHDFTGWYYWGSADSPCMAPLSLLPSYKATGRLFDGVDIYEGDIVAHNHFPNTPVNYGVISYYEGQYDTPGGSGYGCSGSYVIDNTPFSTKGVSLGGFNRTIVDRVGFYLCGGFYFYEDVDISKIPPIAHSNFTGKVITGIER